MSLQIASRVTAMKILAMRALKTGGDYRIK